MSALEIIAIIYLASVALFLFNGSIVLIVAQKPRDRKAGARQIFIAPIAPFALTLLAIRGIHKLWKTADFGDKEQR